MSPADARRLQLVSDIRRDWGQVKAQLDAARSVDPGRTAPEAAHVALALHHAYQAFETMLVRIERALGLVERDGATWHMSLLVDASLPLPARPSTRNLHGTAG